MARLEPNRLYGVARLTPARAASTRIERPALPVSRISSRAAWMMRWRRSALPASRRPSGTSASSSNSPSGSALINVTSNSPGAAAAPNTIEQQITPPGGVFQLAQFGRPRNPLGHGVKPLDRVGHYYNRFELAMRRGRTANDRFDPREHRDDLRSNPL